MSDQAHHWSRAAQGYEEEFIDPYLPEVRNPLRQAVAALAAGMLVLGSIFVLGIANGYFTRLVVTNYRLLILQGYEVCRSWSIHRLPRSLVRYVKPGDEPEKLAVDLDAVKRMLGGSSDKFTSANAIMAFSKRVEQFKAREDDRP